MSKLANHLLGAYAMATGSKIGKPYLNPEYHALPFEHYICFHPSSSNQARCYDYWQDVLNYLFPVLQKYGIPIVQVGGKDDPVYQGVYDARGTSKREMQFIVQHSICLLCVDSCNMHFASAMNKKIIALHAVLFPENSGPVWSNPNDVRLISAPRNGNKPSFSLQENPKTINLIKPEEVANAFFELNGLEERVIDETIFIGRLYNDPSIEIVPGTQFIQNFKGLSVNLRLDLVHDIASINEWGANCRLNIITKFAIPVDLLRAFKSNIMAIQCNVEGSYSKEEIAAMKKTGVPINFFYKGSDTKKLSELRFKFIDEHVHHFEPARFDFQAGLQFITNRKIYDQNSVYLSDALWRDKISSTSNFATLTEPDLDDVDYFKIIKL